MADLYISILLAIQRCSLHQASLFPASNHNSATGFTSINSVALAMFHLWAFTLPENSTIRWFNRRRGRFNWPKAAPVEGPKTQLLTKLGAGHSTRVGSRKKGLKQSSGWHQNPSKSAWDSNLTVCNIQSVFSLMSSNWDICHGKLVRKLMVKAYPSMEVVLHLRSNHIVTCNKSQQASPELPTA